MVAMHVLHMDGARCLPGNALASTDIDTNDHTQTPHISHCWHHASHINNEEVTTCLLNKSAITKSNTRAST